MKIAELSDEELLRRTRALVVNERRAGTELIEHLREIDRRKLFQNLGYSSLYEYCVGALKLSEGVTYRRIRGARAIEEYPPLLELMRSGKISLEAVALLHPHLKDPDIADLVVQACDLRTRALEAHLSRRIPLDARRDFVRFVGSAPVVAVPPAAPATGLPFDAVVDVVSPMFGSAVPPPPPPSAVVPPRAPLPRLVRIAFTADEEFYVLLERVRALMRHKYPDGRLEGVLRDALRALLERKDPLIRWAAARRRRKKTPA